MADDRHYVPGDFYRIDDRTGFKIRAKNSRRQWNNLIVSPKVWEIRQPQDFVKGVADDQTVPNPRSRQPNVFIEIVPATGQFEVYGDLPYSTFLVQNSDAYDTGLNAASNYLNPNGTAQLTVYNGTVSPVTAENLPALYP